MSLSYRLNCREGFRLSRKFVAFLLLLFNLFFGRHSWLYVALDVAQFDGPKQLGSGYILAYFVTWRWYAATLVIGAPPP